MTRMHTTMILAACIALSAIAVENTLAQDATWGGGDGDWTDANWSGGAGPGGAPDFGDNVVLPDTTGTLSITTDLFSQFSYGDLSQNGGTLEIEPTGSVDFIGNVRIGAAPNTTATLNISGGEFSTAGGVDVGFGVGNGAGGSLGTLNFSGEAFVTIEGNLDTWWDDGAVLSVTGPDVDVAVLGDNFFIGTGATIVANINADVHSPIQVAPGTASIQGGQSTLEVNFVDGYVPSVGASWTIIDAANVTGTFVNENVPDLGPGATLSVNYGPGGASGEVVTVDLINVLNLKVDVQTGEATIENPFAGGDDLTIDAYIISSPSGSLIPAGLTGFAGLGEGNWLPGLPPSQNANVLSESNILSSTLVASGASFDIGAIFGSSQEGDTNDDGMVDIVDLNSVRNNFGSGDGSDLSGIPGDTVPFDGLVDITDLNSVRNNFGAMGTPGVQDLQFEFHLAGGETFQGTVEYINDVVIPEPASIVLLLGGLMALAIRRRTR